MNQLVQAFILYLCVASITCEWFNRGAEQGEGKQLSKFSKEEEARTALLAKLHSMLDAELAAATPKNDTAEVASSRTKRQIVMPLAYGGGFGLGYGAYDYNDYYGDYASDYNYDYYDWVCSDTSCQLCDILTSECCNPEVDINCFLPDSCINNPCLGGGTCITSRTVDGRPDFICVCNPGLTGKYCQLTNDYFVGGDIVDPIMMMPPPPPMPYPMPAYQPQQYAPPPPPQYQPPPPPQYQPQPEYQPAPQAYQPTPYQAPPPPQQYQAAPQPAYGQDAAPQSGGFGTRTLGAKRRSGNCPAGQTYNYEREVCAQFTLRRNN